MLRREQPEARMSRNVRDEPTHLDGGYERHTHVTERDAGGLDELLSVVSHDLKSPLSAIMMTAASLQRIDPADPRAAQIRRKGESIQRSAERMARMIDDLHDFASLQSGRFVLEPSVQRSDDLVSSTAQRFAAIATEREIALRTLVMQDLPTVACDRERIEQVLSSLIANALRITPAGGRVSVGAELAGDEIVFFVEDTGPGMGPEEMAGIFERARRGRESSVYKGAGLGLAVAKGVVEAHRGRIWVDSEPGSTTRFSFSVPIAAVDEQRSFA
jgi:signal transduction histidine kinase